MIPWFQIPGFCVGGSGIPGVENKVNCDIIVGYKSVYRMCFAMACFFFLFSLVMIRVRSSKDPRAAVQNGSVSATTSPAPCWTPPALHPHAPFFCVSVSGSSSSWCWSASRWERSSSPTATSTQVRENRVFWAERPSQPVGNGTLALPPVWYYFGVVGSFIFIIIQLILLVDFAHSWNLAWLQNAEDGNRKCWFGGEQAHVVQNDGGRWQVSEGAGSRAALLAVTALNYILAFAAVVLFYVFYTQPDDCTEHKVFISLNLMFCIAASVIAVLPKVQVSVTSLPVAVSRDDP